MPVRVAQPAERPLALEILFRNFAPGDRAVQVEHALELIRTGEVDANGLLVSVSSQIDGAVLWEMQAGKSITLWPPQTASANEAGYVEDALIAAVIAEAQRRRIHVLEAFLDPETLDAGTALRRHGFRNVTSILQLHAGVPTTFPPVGSLVCLEPHSPTNADLFGTLLLQSYQGSLDVPELNEVRRLPEILAGHQASPANPRWFLLRSGTEPIGVLLLADGLYDGTLDLSYLGLIPDARNRGFGNSVLAEVFRIASSLRRGVVTLTVDSRNEPALRLYRRFGFAVVSSRSFFLRTLPKGEPHG